MLNKYLESPPIEASIEKFSHDGRGIARIAGKTTFINGALPGEVVTFKYIRQKKDYAEGQLVSVIHASNARVTPQCKHYAACGGCSWQHLDANQQIYAKQELVLDLLARIAHLTPQKLLPPLTANAWHYRDKARLSVRYVEKKQTALVGFREKINPRYIADITSCSILHEKVDKALLPLRQLINSLDDPHSIAQIEIAAGSEEVALIFRNLVPLSAADADKFCQFGQDLQFRIYLQPSDIASVYLLYPKNSSEYLHYDLPAENLKLQFLPTDFTQINAALNNLMVAQAIELLELVASDQVLDLFCGLGNFSLPIAKRVAQLVGVEGNEAMVARASQNAIINNIQNAQFIAANLEDDAQFIKFVTKDFNKVLLDPPRTGALAIVNNINLIKPESIVYVSCNPTTLARDSAILVHNHKYKLAALGVMDMFPHTTHVESTALFEKG